MDHMNLYVNINQITVHLDYSFCCDLYFLVMR